MEHCVKTIHALLHKSIKKHMKQIKTEFNSWFHKSISHRDKKLPKNPSYASF